MHDHPHDHSRAFGWSVGLNLLIVVVELGAGLWSGSLALVADSAHNFGDVLGLALAWGTSRLARRKSTSRYTYGLRRSSVLAALANALLLLAGTGGLIWEAVERLRLGARAPGEPAIVIGVALLGLVINAGSAFMFSGHGGDVNLKGAFLHLLSDALVSLMVVICGVVLYFTGWWRIDPIATLLVATAILWSTWGLLKESLALSLDAVPSQIAPEAVQEYLLSQPGVESLHDLHIWSLSTNQTALTVHLVSPLGLDDAFLGRVCEELEKRFTIGHSTIQVEKSQMHCHCDPHEHH